MDKTAKERMRRYRNKKRDETVTNGQEALRGSVTLSDGQILDLDNQPKVDLTLLPGWKIEALRRCNEADNMKPLVGYNALEAAKEMLECTR